MSPITILHNTARSKVETALLDATLTPAEVIQFTPTPGTLSEEDETTNHNNNTKKRSNSDNVTSITDFDIYDYSPLVLPAFNIFSSIVSYVNEKLHVKITSFEVNYHPDHAKILNTLLTRSPLNTDQNNYDNIQFVQYGVIQVTGEQVYKQQIVKKNTFLHNLTIISVHNIDSDTMYSKNIPMSRMFFNQRILSGTRGKWFIVTT